MKISIKYQPLIICIYLLISCIGFTQDKKISGWDNQFYFGNKVSWGSAKWKYSGELQMRFKEDFGTLDVWYGEFVASYLANKNIEIVPDFRISRRIGKVEFRPGFGVVFKKIAAKKFQFINQIKWHIDFGTDNYHSQVMRYVFFFNYLVNPHFILSAIAGTFVELSPRFTGWMGIRAGFGASYVFDKLHSINFGYFYGLINQKNGSYTNLGILSFSLTINITKEYQYIPAKYYSF